MGKLENSSITFPLSQEAYRMPPSCLNERRWGILYPHAQVHAARAWLDELSHHEGFRGALVGPEGCGKSAYVFELLSRQQVPIKFFAQDDSPKLPLYHIDINPYWEDRETYRRRLVGFISELVEWLPVYERCKQFVVYDWTTEELEREIISTYQSLEVSTLFIDNPYWYNCKIFAKIDAFFKENLPALNIVLVENTSRFSKLSRKPQYKDYISNVFEAKYLSDEELLELISEWEKHKNVSYGIWNEDYKKWALECFLGMPERTLSILNDAHRAYVHKVSRVGRRVDESLSLDELLIAEIEDAYKDFQPLHLAGVTPSDLRSCDGSLDEAALLNLMRELDYETVISSQRDRDHLIGEGTQLKTYFSAVPAFTGGDIPPLPGLLYVEIGETAKTLAKVMRWVKKDKFDEWVPDAVKAKQVLERLIEKGHVKAVPGIPSKKPKRFATSGIVKALQYLLDYPPLDH